MRPLLGAVLLFCALSARAGDPAYRRPEASTALNEALDRSHDALLQLGYRFDDAAGTVLSPKTKEPVSAAELEQLLAQLQASKRFGALERLQGVLGRGRRAGKLSESDAAELRAMAADPNGELPEGLRGALAAAGSGGAEGLRVQVEQAYADMRRTFDGQAAAALAQFEPMNMPVGRRGQGLPERRPSYFDDSERRLGRALQTSVQAQLSRFPTGRATLERLGKMPDVLVLPLTNMKFAGAYYDEGAKALVVNQNAFVDSLVSKAPVSERPALAKSLKDRKALADYLTGNPQALKSFVEDTDVLMVHELRHAMQAKRGAYYLESARGNAAGVDPLDDERDAYLYENLYLHEKVSLAPKEALKSGFLPYYRSMLNDEGAWRADIDRTYLKNSPIGAASFKTAAELQRERERMSGILSLDKALAAVEKLRLRGMALGSKAIADAERTDARIMERFEKKEYPAMRAEGFLNLSRAERSSGDLGTALLDAVSARAVAPGAPPDRARVYKAAADAAVAELEPRALAWVRAGKGTPNGRASAVNAIAALHPKGGLPRGFEDLRAAAYLDVVSECYGKAQDAADDATRKAWLDGASSWLAALKDDPAISPALRAKARGWREIENRERWR